MGVPKFFRWMSERYPAISQLIAENRIPEFDCLYLDMNGIIHNCTHNDSDSPTFRMTEDKMFITIFNYIEHLYGKIKPKQLFFMALDGVAPRAKMNQQRARRFRTALDNEKARDKAIKEGVEMPKEDAFDSNCITPGTEFMAKLTKQLKYFISKKVSEDVEWQGVEIVLSGHEVPGEGEHKIMEYIRLSKAQNNYDPNLRHCCYGLDADLIMLGLLSHDPHFCLLREEVTFGRQNQKKSKELEHQNFYLMHLCIVREYLELEFQELKEPSALSFPFDMERVIDDFILMAFFVGNDFLPNLPNLHINEGALALMFKVYKSVLPRAGGYLNEGGVINLERLSILLEELSQVEYRFFEAENADASWFKGKQMAKPDIMSKEERAEKRNNRKGQITMSTAQKQIFQKVKQYVNSRSFGKDQKSLDLPPTLPARDRKFVEELADDLHLQWKTVSSENGERHLQLDYPEALESDEEDEEEEEAQLAVIRVLKRYDGAKIEDVSVEESKDAMNKKYDEKFQLWKDKYYKSKFEWGLDSEGEMRKLTENYVQGLQWVLFYYYRGIASWPWFYGYHYSPMISDVRKGLNADMNFQLGQPFRPYQQLMGVLPDRSKKIVPPAYHDLMTNPDSPVIDLYPRDFELDMNGKKMDWEAVVKIPFIDEKRLLAAMKTKDDLLTEVERVRNDFGVSMKFTYSAEVDFTYPSSMVGVFPDLPHCRCVENIFDLPTMDGLDVYIGLADGAKLGKSALAGFPSLKTLPQHGALGFHGVSVFQQESRNESMVITLLDTDTRTKSSAAQKQLGKRVHVGYPFLAEGRVVRVSDELFDYFPGAAPGAPPITVPHGPPELTAWKNKADRIENTYSRRLGMVIGSVESLVHVDILKGLQKTEEGATIKEYAHVPGIETDYAAQTIVDEVISEDQRFLEKAALPIQEEFPVGSRAFFLGEFNYGRPLEILSHKDNRADIWISILKGKEPEFARDIVFRSARETPYTPSYAVAKNLGLNPLVLSKITSSLSITVDDSRTNLGLNLKFEAKKLKVLGYSRRSSTGWEFSQKAIELIRQYMVNFPDFIAGIQRNPQGNIYQAEDFFPGQDETAKVKEIQNWLKSIESKNFQKVPLDAEQLDSTTVMKIEQASDLALQNGPRVEGAKVKLAPRSALLKPADAEHRLGNQRFTVGDRVVYVQESGRVPIASRGTVVGLTRTSRTTLLDVLFDVTFMSGTSLEERCSPFRGSTVPITSVLNVTDRQLVAGSRAAQDHRPIQNGAQPLTVNGYGAPTGPNGQGQLKPANAPPPLRGSFRGAASGAWQINSSRAGGARGGLGYANANANANANGEQKELPYRNGPESNGNANGTFRGRGNTLNGGGRSGMGNLGRPAYTPIDRGDPSAGVVPNNPNFQPKSYNQTPPPANMENRGGGRGGRGRGGGYGSGRGNGGFRGRGGGGGEQKGRGGTSTNAVS
ncbi:hypothetical protein MMC25_004393 [Agyrium rufum]|nr:hypothetical protein [Agyrium rufum]